MENENALHVFKTFNQSGLHRRNNNDETLEWPSKGYCVFKIKTSESQYSVQTQQSNRNGHAEENALNFIKMNSHYNENETITLYLTYSPCSKCADLLQAFYNQNRFGIKLRIFFTRLYKIPRASCQNAGNRCCQVQVTENETGLRNLRETNITIAPFTPNAWGQLVILLLANDGRSAEDQEVLGDLNEILRYDGQRVEDQEVLDA